VKENLLNNQEVFNKLFVDDNLFASLDEKQFFERLNSFFKQADATNDSTGKREAFDAVVNKVTVNQEIKQLINNQLEKTKVLKTKLDDTKDELFAD
jgi:hypothetical protein